MRRAVQKWAEVGMLTGIIVGCDQRGRIVTTGEWGCRWRFGNHENTQSLPPFHPLLNPQATVFIAILKARLGGHTVFSERRGMAMVVYSLPTPQSSHTLNFTLLAPFFSLLSYSTPTIPEFYHFSHSLLDDEDLLMCCQCSLFFLLFSKSPPCSLCL